MTAPAETKPIGAMPGLLNPDMPAQEMRLHMGEMTAQEMRTARAAIRWANSRVTTPAPAGHVVVKRLDWEDHPEQKPLPISADQGGVRCVAYSIVGRYDIDSFDGNNTFHCFVPCEGSGFWRVPYGTLEAAKAAAQADFEKRILSALSAASAAPAPERPCTCHPDDNPPKPCPQKYALSDCREAAPAPERVEGGPASQPTREAERIGELEEALKVCAAPYFWQREGFWPDASTPHHKAEEIYRRQTVARSVLQPGQEAPAPTEGGETR